MEDKQKHLELIQNVVNRMANHSFLLKGWGVTIVAGLYALTTESPDEFIFYLAVIALVAFWFLDGYYLQRERLFRALYDEVRVKDQTDFSMHVEHLKTSKRTLPKTLMSATELGFYLPLIVLVGIVTYALI